MYDKGGRGKDVLRNNVKKGGNTMATRNGADMIHEASAIKIFKNRAELLSDGLKLSLIHISEPTRPY